MSWECLPKEQLFSLMDSFSIVEAAALVAGCPPSSVVPEYDYNGNPCGEPCILDNATDYQKSVFDLALKSMVGAIEGGRLKALIKTTPVMQLYKTDSDEAWQAKYFISPNETRVERDELIRWFSSRQCYPDFFFNCKNTPEYLIKDGNPQYAPKLCAIVHAWEATRQAEITNTLGGLSVKQYASDWFKENAEKYGVIGVTNYDDMASILNWATNGGRPTIDKHNLKNDKLTLRNNKPQVLADSLINSKDEYTTKVSINKDVVINKSDLKANPFQVYGKALDDDLPF